MKEIRPAWRRGSTERGGKRSTGGATKITNETVNKGDSREEDQKRRETNSKKSQTAARLGGKAARDTESRSPCPRETWDCTQSRAVLKKGSTGARICYQVWGGQANFFGNREPIHGGSKPFRHQMAIMKGSQMRVQSGMGKTSIQKKLWEIPFVFLTLDLNGRWRTKLGQHSCFGISNDTLGPLTN